MVTLERIDARPGEVCPSAGRMRHAGQEGS